MKRAAILLTAAMMVLSLGACGGRGGNQNTMGNSASNTNGSASHGAGTGDAIIGNSNGAGGTNAGNTAGTTGTTGSSGMNSTNHNTGGTLGNDVRNAVDNVGRAAENVMDKAENAVAGRTSFQQMLDNARVHDTDGILTDGENSHW